MTKEDENPQHDKSVAALLAASLVSQVLDEASVIANAVKNSGEPWQYASSLKKGCISRLSGPYDDNSTFTTVSNGDSDYLNDNNGQLSSTIVTSTPQKNSVHAIKSGNDSNVIIGQGDEVVEISNAELRNSTSMIINHLFDMSDVEHVNICDETDIISTNCSYHNDFLIAAMTEIMDSYINSALNIVFKQDHGDDYSFNLCDSPDLTEISSYSFLSDSADIPKEITCSTKNYEAVCENTINEEIDEIENENKINDNEVAFYETAYLTLNRDYEQYSEEDESVLQDPKTIPMQEVDLLTANTSTENLQPLKVKEKTELFPSGLSPSTPGSRKSSLVRRCRLQGVRLLSCLRGWWWRRKLPGRRKAPRPPGSIRGMCPLSPDARRRAASLLDQRNLRTPSPSTSLLWKFNTVNEALVHSSRWKDFGLKMSLNENDDF